MKNLFIGLGILAMIGATSCKKNHTCECTVTAGSVVTNNDYTIKDTKENAKAECESSTSVSSGGVTTSSICELK